MAEPSDINPRGRRTECLCCGHLVTVRGGQTWESVAHDASVRIISAERDGAIVEQIGRAGRALRDRLPRPAQPLPEDLMTDPAFSNENGRPFDGELVLIAVRSSDGGSVAYVTWEDARGRLSRALIGDSRAYSSMVYGHAEDLLRAIFAELATPEPS